MPDISYSVNVVVNATAFSESMAASNVTSDFQTTEMLAVTLRVGTATQAVSTAAAVNLGLCFARALHTTGTHTVSFGRIDGTNFYGVFRLKAGEPGMSRLEPGNYAAKSNAEGGKLLLKIYGE